MTNSMMDSDRIESTAFSQTGLHTISSWLNAPPPLNTPDDLLPLLSHLATLRASQVTPEQRAQVLERLYTRSISVLTTLLPALSSVALPIPITRKTRQLIRSLQNLLRTLAEDLLAAHNSDDVEQIYGLHHAPDLTLWRGLYALAQHLLISNLAASPAAIGIWQQLHQTYNTARRLDLVSHMPEGVSGTIQNIYFSSIVLACAQPASFTSREVDFVAAYLGRFADRIDPIPITASKTPAAFWIDPARDVGGSACSRKSAPPETSILYFSCARLAALLREQLTALEAGEQPRQINLPDFAGTPAGRGVLRRLITYWGEPGKRRFPRRRQNYRSVLCVGLDSLWRLFQEGDETSIETSSWMITNESPDGYAVMHVSGKTGGMSVGDVTAMRTESGGNWQICIVRWAMSENQEHIELGLQILATSAVPAFLALPVVASNSVRLSVLILPEIQALRPTEMLVVPSGALDNQPGKLILVVEKENIVIREMKSIRLDEQNSQIEVFSIKPDSLSV